MPHGIPVIKIPIQNWTDACSQKDQKEGEKHMRGIHQPYELSLYSKRVNEFEALPPERELELARRYRMGDVDAGQVIINANLRLSLKISKSYYHHARNPLDIVQEGNMGLVKALDKFDPDKGITFSSHAAWWVHTCIRNFIQNDSQQEPGYPEHLFSLESGLSDGDIEESFFTNDLSDGNGKQGDGYLTLMGKASISLILYSDNGPFNNREKYLLEGRFFGEPGPVPGQVARKITIFKERAGRFEGEAPETMRDHRGTKRSQDKESFLYSNIIFTLGKKMLPEFFKAAG
jgi:RNA polymerase sigma factor (sigma-70 family)